MPTKSHGRAALDAAQPLTTVDVVVLTILASRLHVLLVRQPQRASEPFPGQWALPGGRIDLKRDESLEDCALRKLRDNTGVRNSYLEQLGSWGGRGRDPRGWSATHVYFALLAATDLRPEKGGNTADAALLPVENDRVKAAALAFDHAHILRAALERVRGKAGYTSLPVHLLPREFTLTELQRVFEIVLGRTLEKKAFRTRVLAADLLESVDQVKETSRRPAQLYRAKRRGELVYFPRALEQPR